MLLEWSVKILKMKTASNHQWALFYSLIVLPCCLFWHVDHVYRISLQIRECFGWNSLFLDSLLKPKIKSRHLLYWIIIYHNIVITYWMDRDTCMYPIKRSLLIAFQSYLEVCVWSQTMLSRWWMTIHVSVTNDDTCISNLRKIKSPSMWYSIH